MRAKRFGEGKVSAYPKTSETVSGEVFDNLSAQYSMEFPKMDSNAMYEKRTTTLLEKLMEERMTWIR